MCNTISPFAAALRLYCYTSDVDRVEEIEAAIAQLPPDEFRRLAQWLHAREQSTWDSRIDADAASGKLDFLFDEAEDEAIKGTLREWPPTE
ncbi:MAG: hypothetical protein JO307_31010 [Bryobacterales bacterium]|nr:hypothetical protein [Bryobacterales bacterium]MBV9399065.1 hypothetical protein [Bryobacterales bacterium]